MVYIRTPPLLVPVNVITSVGALAEGSIATGFGNIDNAANTLNTGAITAAAATFTGAVLISTDGSLQLGTASGNQGAINSEQTLFINIDSNNNQTDRSFIIAKDRVGASGGTQLVVVTEAGNLTVGTSDGVGIGTLTFGDLAHEGTNAGFYSTAPIALQTSVAVTAAGIHAALVALGLITA